MCRDIQIVKGSEVQKASLYLKIHLIDQIKKWNMKN